MSSAAMTFTRRLVTRRGVRTFGSQTSSGKIVKVLNDMNSEGVLGKEVVDGIGGFLTWGGMIGSWYALYKTIARPYLHKPIIFPTRIGVDTYRYTLNAKGLRMEQIELKISPDQKLRMLVVSTEGRDAETWSVVQLPRGEYHETPKNALLTQTGYIIVTVERKKTPALKFPVT